MSNRAPNSKECAYGGYKLSSIDAEIQTGGDITPEQVLIGAPEDDTFYAGSDACGRVEIEIHTDAGVITLDLEDVLVHARQYCSGIYERVLREGDTEK